MFLFAHHLVGRKFHMTIGTDEPKEYQREATVRVDGAYVDDRSFHGIIDDYERGTTHLLWSSAVWGRINEYHPSQGHHLHFEMVQFGEPGFDTTKKDPTGPLPVLDRRDVEWFGDFEIEGKGTSTTVPLTIVGYRRARDFFRRTAEGAMPPPLTGGWSPFIGTSPSFPKVGPG